MRLIMNRVVQMVLPIVLAGCSKHEYRETPVDIGPIPAISLQPSPAPAPTPAQRLGTAKTLPEAVAIAAPLFADQLDTTDPAGLVFALWWSAHLDAPGKLPITKRSLVLKDPQAERGKWMCTMGSITEIQVDRSAGPALYIGGIIDSSMAVTRFVAVGSTGELVEKSSATFCGVVVGRYDYSNVSGGQTRSIMLVGMFDLPENAARARGIAGK